jgi:DNA-binding transcriptional MerR regulator
MGNTMTGAPVRLTLQDFADREGIPLGTIRYWVEIGYAPPSYRIGKHRVMDLEDVIRWEIDLKANAR